MYVTDEPGSGSANSFSQDSESIQWSLGRMNPLQWNFMGEPAWKWATFVVAMSLFLAAWSGVIRYMK